MDKTKGITLVALVITIIVLLILAGISIATLMGENGIVEKAQKAKESTQIAQYSEELQIIGLGLQPDRTIEQIGTQEYMNLYEEKIRNDDIFEGYQEITQLSYLDEITIQIITKEGYVFWVTEDDVKFIGGREDIPPIPQKELYASVKGNMLTFSDNEEVAKANADNESSYWNITDQVYTRSGWGSNAVVTTPWFASKDKIEVIDFKTIVQPTNMDNYFCYLTQLTKIEGIENLRTNDVTSMNGTFYNCTNLETLDLSKFNTSKVTSMNAMFANCYKLANINVAGFNTSNVTDMNSMFTGCKKIQELNLSGFDTKNVNNMGYMFQNCTELKKIELSGFNTSEVTTMIEMFANCSALTEMDLSDFSTGKVENMKGMFSSCENIENINCSSFNTVNVSNFNTSKVTTMTSMFQEDWSLTTLDLSSFDTSNVTDMTLMFGACGEITKIQVGSKWKLAPNTTDMFKLCGVSDTELKV